MNILTLFIVAVAALFNVGQLPQPLPTVYQLTLNSVESVICDPTSPQRSTVCSMFDALRLPATPVVFRIAAPLPTPVTLMNSLLLNGPSTEADLRLPPKVASRALINSPPTPSQSTSTSSTWTLPSSDVILQLLCGLMFASCVALISIFIWCNLDALLESIVRGLTWFFCGPLPRRRRATSKDYYWHTTDRVDYGNYDDINLYYEPDLPAFDFVPLTLFTPQADVISDPSVAEEQDIAEQVEPRRRVRSAARCQRVRRQTAQAREEEHEDLEPAAVQTEGSAEPAEPPRNRRGGKQVKRRQRYQELKESRRAAANAEAGPSTRPLVVPEFNDDNFPALPGTISEAHPVQYKHSFAVVAKVGRPSLSAVVRTSFWTVRINTEEPESPPRRTELGGRGAEGSWAVGLEDSWIDLEEEAWRKGRRKKKKSS